jgi:CubicO group peptidase (beta-lactamase class C family)
VRLHERGGPITLLDLATYTSGLPNTPGTFRPPLAAYTVDKLYEFLSTYVPDYEPGTHYEYANLGFGLLGIALARRAGMSYEDLLIERVFEPLWLDNTRITLTDNMKRHLSQGHSTDLKPALLLDLPAALQGAGAVRSNAKNLAVFLRACTGLARTPLNAALARLLDPQRPTALAGTTAALGWFISSGRKEEIVWKSGLTDGFTSFVGFSKRRHCGTLVLSNFVGASREVGTTELGMKLINPDFGPGDLRLLYAGMR